MLIGFQSSFVAYSVVYTALVGIWQGLKISKDMGLQKIIIESDSMTALQLIQKSNQQWHWRNLNICWRSYIYAQVEKLEWHTFWEKVTQ